MPIKSIVTEWEKNDTFIILLTNLNYQKNIIKVAKLLKHRRVCYVSLNKTYDALTETFRKNNVDYSHFAFIDVISKTIKSVDTTDNCFFVSSPSALTELSLSIKKFLEFHFDVLVFDSITNLLIYHKKNVIEKFLLNLLNDVKMKNTKALFLALQLKENESFIKETYTFVDEAVRL